MSYKSEFASNNTDLQALIDKANALPDQIIPENLDSELATQDSLISQIATTLEGKTAPAPVEPKYGVFKSPDYGPTLTIDGFDSLPEHFYLFPISSSINFINDSPVSACYENGVLTVMYCYITGNVPFGSKSTTGSLSYANGALTVNLTKSITGNSNNLLFQYIAW